MWWWLGESRAGSYCAVAAAAAGFVARSVDATVEKLQNCHAQLALWSSADRRAAFPDYWAAPDSRSWSPEICCCLAGSVSPPTCPVGVAAMVGARC